jgi:hypothetical protein
MQLQPVPDPCMSAALAGAIQKIGQNLECDEEPQQVL